jgi:hypothetical protein
MITLVLLVAQFTYKKDNTHSIIKFVSIVFQFVQLPRWKQEFLEKASQMFEHPRPSIRTSSASASSAPAAGAAAQAVAGLRRLPLVRNVF